MLRHARSNFKAGLNCGEQQRLFSVRQEFPSEWYKFTSARLSQSTPRAPLVITLKPEHYPFWSQGRVGTVRSVGLYAESAKDLQVSDKQDGTGNNDTLVKNDSLGGLRSGVLKDISFGSAIGTWTMYFDNNSIKDLWIAVNVKWEKQSKAAA